MRTATVLAFVSLFAWVCAPAAKAAQVNITATYSPNKANPTHNSFVNTTPQAGYCQWYPAACANLFSIALPITFTSLLDIQPPAVQPDPRMGAYFRMPSSFRTVMVTHEKNGTTAELKFRVSGFGGAYRLSMPNPPAHAALWDRTWVNAPAPCRTSGSGYYSRVEYRWFWLLPEGAGACIKKAKVTIPRPFKYKDMTISYELITPDPLNMDLGRYHGSLTLGVGPDRDLDTGYVMTASDDTVTINFNLLVNHLLKIEFAPGSERAILQPPQGWQAWMNTGRNPPSLSASQRFNLSSSGKFRIYLECEYSLTDTCAIQEASARSKVPVDISITLPYGVVKRGSQQPVQRQRLRMGSANAEEFQSVQAQFDRVASLHYDVAASATAQMVAYAGQTYRGTATVVFDASF
ncbi:hypothetical protein [Pseudomonas sp. RIT-PI-S]|uniref:hypothetical protein n=1 Tax=Pseudomonas sp. RIT-PI-S TaxID=3035295 RepID=UPI0021D825B0|nr:hypothetical protein [Pseudomonas sp. RIT-PI-S]